MSLGDKSTSATVINLPFVEVNSHSDTSVGGGFCVKSVFPSIRSSRNKSISYLRMSIRYSVLLQKKTMRGAKVGVCVDLCR